jgi:GNAT superfamily N-acetyltransferase
VESLNYDLEIYVPNKSESEYIGKRLLEYNLDMKPLEQKEPFVEINRCIKNSDGDVIGGILAIAALWHILHIDTMWVRQEFRGNKIASKLIQDVEEYAKRLGCHLSYLETYDFQAKEFYINNGYKIFGVLEDCPKGHTCYSLSKRL